MRGLRLVETHVLEALHKAALFDLWNREYPVNLVYRDMATFEAYLQNLQNQKHILLIDKTTSLVGWAFAFDRDGERWFALILSSHLHGRGWGQLLVNKLKASERELNGWVIDRTTYEKSDGTRYISPLGFYLKTGFRILHEKRLELEHVSAVKIKWTGDQAQLLPAILSIASGSPTYP